MRSGRWTGYIHARNRPASHRAAPSAFRNWPTSTAACLEQPPASHCEQRVSAEQRVIVGEVIGDVPGGVGGNLDHPRVDAAERHLIPLLHGPVDAGNLAAFSGGAGDGRAGRFLDLKVRAGVIGMPVGVPYIGDLPAAPRRLGQYRRPRTEEHTSELQSLMRNSYA